MYSRRCVSYVFYSLCTVLLRPVILENQVELNLNISIISTMTNINLVSIYENLEFMDYKVHSKLILKQENILEFIWLSEYLLFRPKYTAYDINVNHFTEN